MTLIIGSKAGWMVADRRALHQGETWPIEVHKIHSYSEYLIASSGDSAIRSRLAKEIANSENRPVETIIERARAGAVCSDVLLVGKDRLELFMDNGHREIISSDWWCIGSGAHIAYGYLIALENTNYADVRNDYTVSMDAVSVAAKLLPGVSYNSDVRVTVAPIDGESRK